MRGKMYIALYMNILIFLWCATTFHFYYYHHSIIITIIITIIISFISFNSNSSSSSSTSCIIFIIIIISSGSTNMSVLNPTSTSISELFICFLLFYINIPHHFGNKVAQLFCFIPAITPYGEISYHSFQISFLFTSLVNIRFICDDEVYLLTVVDKCNIFSLDKDLSSDNTISLPSWKN